jgi:hypothetical protein
MLQVRLEKETHQFESNIKELNEARCCLEKKFESMKAEGLSNQQ